MHRNPTVTTCASPPLPLPLPRRQLPSETKLGCNVSLECQAGHILIGLATRSLQMRATEALLGSILDLTLECQLYRGVEETYR